MNNSVYKVNKGINRSIEFKGLRAQYIWYLAAGMLLLLVLFAIAYLMGINSYVCLVFVLAGGAIVLYFTYGLSDRYGEHGLMKALAAKKIPKLIFSSGRSCFQFPKQNRT